MPSIVLVMKPHSRLMTLVGPPAALGPCWASAEVVPAVRPNATVPATMSRRVISVIVLPRRLLAEHTGGGRLVSVELPVLLECDFELQRGIQRHRVGKIAAGGFLRRDDIVEIVGVGDRVLRTHAGKAERRRHIGTHGGDRAARRGEGAAVAGKTGRLLIVDRAG